MTTEVAGRVDGTVGGDIDPPPRRSLSVSQLQGGLRAAHHGVAEPGTNTREVDQTSGDGVAADRQSREVLEHSSNPSPTRRARLGAALSRAAGLQDLDLLLAARRGRRPCGIDPGGGPG